MTPTLLRGSVLVRAIWLDGAWHDTAALRRRALALWEPGALVLTLDGGLLVRFPTARRMDCATAPGMPFVEVADGLWAWAPSPAERAAATPGGLHRVRAGRRDEMALATLADAEPWRWFEVAAPIVEVTPLGPPPAPIAPPVVPDLRTRMGQPPAAPEAEALRAELLRRRDGRPEAPGVLPMLAGGLLALFLPRTMTGGAGGGASGTAMAPAGGPGWLDGLFGWLARRSDAATVRGAPAEGAGSTANAPPRAPDGPGWLQRMATRMALPLFGPLLGQRHGRYLSELVDLFEKGDLDAALRRAIPLGGDGSDLPASFGLPSPRDDLSLRLGRGGASSAVRVDASIMTLLRDMYKRALDKLVAEGRIEEAAFVLVELMRDHRGAIDLLEKHDKFAVAAEIAEASDLPPEVAVRLWVRAGKLDRALVLARRTGSFAVCLPVVEAADTERGRAFRAAYAAHLAAGGDPAAAVAVCWPEPTLRPLSVRWLDAALATGGVAGVRLLPRRLLLDPASFEDVWARARALLDGDAPEDIALREALAAGLLAADSPGARAIARPLLRRAVADQARSPAHTTSFDALRTFAEDPALAADLPRPVTGPTLARRTELVRWAVDPSDRGTTPIHDLAFLPRGRVLVALGEAGARVLDRKGRVLATFDEPAYGLAVHDAGTRAIAVAPRAGAARLARLDLDAGTATRWFDAPLSHYAATYAGSLWFVADGEALLALDPLSDRPTALWRVATGGPIHALARGPDGVTIDVGEPVRQIWRYAATLRLDARTPYTTERLAWRGLGAEGQRLEAQFAPDDGLGGAIMLRRQGASETAETSQVLALPRHTVSFRLATVAHGAGVTLATGATPDRALALVYLDGRLALAAELLGADRVVARLDANTLLLGDDLGRIEAYELAGGTRVRGLRV